MVIEEVAEYLELANECEENRDYYFREAAKLSQQDPEAVEEVQDLLERAEKFNDEREDLLKRAARAKEAENA